MSRATVYKWLARFREHGEAGLHDRRNRLDAKLEARILLARRRRRWGPHTLEFYLGVPRSTAYKVLVRNGCSRLSDFDRPTGKKIRYVRDRPGELLHGDAKKLGRIPDGGGWRVNGREGNHSSGQGYDKLHIAVDDHSRLAFVQVHPDEKGPTCAAFLADTVAWFAAQGIIIERVMTDNANNYTISRDFQKVLSDHRIRHNQTQADPAVSAPDQRQGRTFNRTLVGEFAYARTFRSNQARLDTLPRRVRYYSTRRRHTALDGHSPHEIVNNLCGKNIEPRRAFRRLQTLRGWSHELPKALPA